MSRHSDAGPIAGLCFLACAAIVVLALIGHAIHPYLPAMREFLLWAMAPQFAIGMFVGASLFAVGVVLISWRDDHV